MELMTFNEILTYLCDAFDGIISPRKIARRNTNIIYLIFKAVAKGYEVINNVAVTLSNKFDPANCSISDLNSVASLVGTKRLLGTVSGLRITITNTNNTPAYLLAGTYTYDLDDTINFTFTVTSDTLISPLSFVAFTAFSNVKGAVPVSSQNDIKVKSNEGYTISEVLTFSCTDNNALLGADDETDIDFRKRILSDTKRQDEIIEMQTALRNLPYVYDCRIVFNQSFEPVSYGDFTIPPYYMLIVLSGDKRSEIAEIVASHGIYPTLMVDEDNYVSYKSSVFASGDYKVYLADFSKKQFKASVQYKANAEYVSEETVENRMRSALFNGINTNIHSEEITENRLYEIVNSLGIDGVSILNVDLEDTEGNSIPYLSLLATELPELTEVTFIRRV